MYSLDVDFLNKRRGEQKPQFDKRTIDQAGSDVSGEGNLPLIIGLIVGVGAIGLMGGYWFLTGQQTAQVQRKINQLQQDLGQVQNQKQLVAQKREDLKQAETNLTALANIFNQIKPLSAILEDVRDRAPQQVQINSFNQQTNEQGSSNFSLQGVAKSYEAVNHFALTLQRSPLIKAKTVNVQTATKTDLKIELINDPPENLEKVSPPEVINYQISFEPSDKGASDLLGVLQDKGATGLVTRIRTLEKKGIIQ